MDESTMRSPSSAGPWLMKRSDAFRKEGPCQRNDGRRNDRDNGHDVPDTGRSRSARGRVGARPVAVGLARRVVRVRRQPLRLVDLGKCHDVRNDSGARHNRCLPRPRVVRGPSVGRIRHVGRWQAGGTCGPLRSLRLSGLAWPPHGPSTPVVVLQPGRQRDCRVRFDDETSSQHPFAVELLPQNGKGSVHPLFLSDPGFV